MKYEGVVCPKCGSGDMHVFQIKKASLFEDSLYETLDKEFGEDKLLVGSCDGIVAQCVCHSCSSHYSVFAKLKVQVEGVITRKEYSDVICLKAKDYVSEQK